MPRDTPRILAPPALLWALCLGAAWGLERRWPWDPLPTLAFPTRLALGGAGWTAALLLAVLALRAMGRKGTPAEPWKPSTALVDAGPFRISRNPIYVALVASLAALAPALGSGWYLGGAALLFLLLDQGVIRAEERYLVGKFGAPYTAYLGRVRRWL